jgi:hypothetical protein
VVVRDHAQIRINWDETTIRHRQSLYLLVVPLSGQRHQRGTGPVARHAQNQQPRGSNLPPRRAVLTSQSHAHRRIPTTSQSQTRPRRRHHRHRPQDRHPVLYPRHPPSRIRPHSLARQRRSAATTNPRSTHAASSSTRLPTRPFGGFFLHVT